VILIDAAVHVSARSMPTGDALAALRRFDTDSAVIFADAQSPDLTADNRYVLMSGQEFDCYPFYYAGGNPFTDTRLDLENPPNLEDYCGVRWHGWFAESEDRTGRVDRHELEFAVMTMESPEFTGLMSALAFYDMPIMFEEDFAVTLEFVARFPELTVIIPSMGVFSGGEENIVGRLQTNPRVHFTTSHSRLDRVLVSRVGPERLLYASDFPYGDPAQSIERVKQLGLGDEDEALVFGENVERLFHRSIDEVDVEES